MRKLPPLTALRAFEAAARHLSFKAAADEVSLTPSAISHEVRLLEGPNPVAIDRLPPGAIASFVSDYLMGNIRDTSGQLTFDVTAQGLAGDGTLEQGRTSTVRALTKTILRRGGAAAVQPRFHLEPRPPGVAQLCVA